MAHTYNAVSRPGFLSPEDFLMIRQAFGESSRSSEFDALERYYNSAITADVAGEELVPVKLFKETLVSLLRQKKTAVPPDVERLFSSINQYLSRLTETVAMISRGAKPVAKVMHFVWVGGSDVGAIQRDYMNIWRTVLAPEGYTFNLWYDSDAVMAYEMNRVILESARVDAMQSGGAQLQSPSALAKMIENRARALKLQMSDFLQQPQWAGRADAARIDLMVRAYGKDRDVLDAKLATALQTHRDMIGPDMQLRDVRQEFADHFLADVYQREIALRGNFAAASDVVRLQTSYLEGGRYSDVDYLPALAEKLGGVDINQFTDVQRIGVLQLLLNHDDALMPGRDRQQYSDRTAKIPEQYKEALTAFARSKPGARKIFVAPQDRLAPPNGLRTPTKTNAHFLAHAGSGMLRSVMELIRFNYDCIYEVEQRLTAAGQSWTDEGHLLAAIQEVLNAKRRPGVDTPSQELLLTKLTSAIYGYYLDGIRVESRATIDLTGPGAVVIGADRFIETDLLVAYQTPVRDALTLNGGYNTFTEEEQKSGWTVNGTPEDWLAKEQEKWVSGKLQSRYVGQLADLLKDNTLTFKQGWPVVEGRPVLQQMMDDLGEPFIRAMKDKLSGDITFNKAFSIGFDIRQQILAQPGTDLPVSHGDESTSNLNELFTRIAYGSLALEQLSPLQRTMLGGIFGAERLDTAGFAGAWQAATDIAGETTDGGLFARFNAIEKTLREHQSPAFAAGRARGAAPDSRSSRELKVHAMAEPLTLRQWGERIGQIDTTAQREYLKSIFNRGGRVRDVFFKAGAYSARQMPQDLLQQTTGDPGRRCYPLTLLMAAAVAAGDSAERALIGHVANASLTPDDANSRAFLLALDELHEVPVTAVGKPRGLQSLAHIVQSLDAKTAPAALLLDTGNHALLIAKTLVGETPAYRFYDPNFGIFSFAGTQGLKSSIERYLSDGTGTMARLYGLGDVPAAPFNVVELNLATIADKAFSSNVRLERFLQSAPIIDGQTISVWEKQAAGRSRSLSENARLGASLAQLDARYWTQELDQAMRLLRKEHSLGPEYLPLLETVQKDPDANYALTLVDVGNPHNVIKLTTADVRFKKIKEHLQRLVKTLAGEPKGLAEADGGSRLSFAFAIQTLITEMRRREYQAKAGQLPALSIALQVQVYVSYAQLGVGVVTDAAQMIGLVRQVAASEQALAVRQSSISGRLLGRASSAVGVGFSAVNIGFDIYGLTVANNQEQRSRLTTQLVFDVAALGLDIVALAVGGTVGSAAAILSVPLLGVGIGATAIASNLGQISDKAKGVGAHLRRVQNAYGPTVYTRKDGVLRFKPEAVITHLDLQGNQIHFDSQKFYPMDRGGLELPQSNGDLQRLHEAIDIREALELPDRVALMRVVPSAIHTVVLPCTPICYYGYAYQWGTAGYEYEPSAEERFEPRAPSEILTMDLTSVFSPFVTAAQNIIKLSGDRIETRFPDLRNSAADKLEYDKQGNRRFYLNVNTPVPHILYQLLPFNQPTRIKVTLDETVSQLVVPELPPEWKGRISYEIFNPRSGFCQLWLTPGLVAVSLRNYGPTQWAVHAPWVGEEGVQFEASTILVDGIRIDRNVDFIELANGELFKFDWLQERLVLQSVTLGEKNPPTETSTADLAVGSQPAVAVVLARIRTLAAEHRVAATYVPLHKFQVPLSPTTQPIYVTGFYDVAQDRLVYARNLPQEVNDGIVLAAAGAEHAWFYHPEHATVWRVDVITGTVNHRYRLMNPVSGCNIVGSEPMASGLRVWQKMREIEGGVAITLEYLLSDSSLVLSAIKTSAAWDDYTPSHSADHWQAWVDRFKTPGPYVDQKYGLASSLSTWGPIQFIQIRTCIHDDVRDLAWIRLADRMYFPMARTSGLGLDTLMLFWNDGIADAALFYSKETRLLRRGAGAGISADQSEVIGTDFIDVTQAGSRYIATKDDGRLFEVDKQGALKFVGVGRHWLTRNPDWAGALPALAEFQGEAFSIIGLDGVSGNVMAAWCIGGRVVLADMGHGKELALLGLTPDQQAAWLLDVTAGQLYRQPVLGMDALEAVYSKGQLLHAERLPVAQKVWSQWSFAEVLPNGQGLLGQTTEGVNLELVDQQPARVISVEKRRSERKSFAQLQASLETLLKGQSRTPVLQVDNLFDQYLYYVPDLKRLSKVQGRVDGRWSVFLGTRDESVSMLFDPIDSLIFSDNSSERTLQRGSYAERSDEVLSLGMNQQDTDLVALLPDGVDKLILVFGEETRSYRVSEEAWQRLDCVVVYPLHPLQAGMPQTHTLFLDMAASEHLLVSLVDTHLVLTDPDNAHSLILRDAVAADLALRAEVLVAINNQPAQAISSWVARLQADPTNAGGITLQSLLAEPVSTD